MAFDILSFALGQKAGKASGGSSEKVILAEQTFEGFALDSNYGAYIYSLVPAPYALTVGETYFVKWDETVYECVAQDLSAMSAGMVAIGNISALTGGGAGNNEPFIINYVQGANAGGFLAFDNKTSHTVKIYQKVSGGGGGSLPAGTYWEPLDIKPAKSTGVGGVMWYQWNGVLYAFINSTTGYIRYACKYQNGTWTQLTDLGDNYNIGAMSAYIIEFNGKLHITGGEDANHYIFDGATLKKGTVIPNKVTNTAMFVQNNKLKVYSYYDAYVYVWDEETDAWTQEAQIGNKYDYIYFYNHNGTIYCVKSNKGYIYDGTQLISEDTIATQVTANNVKTAVIGDYRYYINSAYIYKKNLNTFEATKMCYIPSQGGNERIFAYDGKPAITVYSSTYATTGFMIHEVTE